jgi:putative phage-type endonuclease
MTFQTIDISGLSREEWLELRRPYLGGSDAAAACRRSPYTSAYELALDKMGALPPRDENEANETMYWGSKHEATILAHMASLPEYEGYEFIDTKKEMYVSDVYPWASVNLDGLMVRLDGTLVGIEAKTASEYKRDEWREGIIGLQPDTGMAPEHYVLQCHHAMAVRRDIAYFILGALVGGNKFFRVVVMRDEETIRQLMRLEGDFVDMVHEGRLPNPTGSARDHEILTQLSPEPAGSIELDAEVSTMAAEYLLAKDDESEATARRKALGNLLLQEMKSAKKATAGGYLLTRIQSKVPEHMVKASSRDYITVKDAREEAVHERP